MAENLPEPPSFAGLVVAATVEPAVEVPEAVIETDTTELAVVVGDAVEGVIDPVAEGAVEATATETVETTQAHPIGDAPTAEVETIADETVAGTFGSVDGAAGGDTGDGEIDREAAFAAIQAAAEAAASAEVAADAAARAEAVADVAIEIIGNHEDEDEADPRFAALGLSPDYDAAEAEALAAAGSSDEDIPEIDDDALAARLADLIPGKNKDDGAENATTQIVVVGLVSVASIASFKRHLGRVPGVQSVGVSSGPDGEFVFAVKHAGDAVVRDAIPSLPSFQARVTGSADGVVHVTAHDPEADA
jgi:hypothetical protein